MAPVSFRILENVLKYVVKNHACSKCSETFINLKIITFYIVALAVEVGAYHPVQGICYKKKFFWKIQKLELVLKFLVFFLLSTNNILTFVEDFKSIPVPSKEISSLEVEQIFEILTLWILL